MRLIRLKEVIYKTGLSKATLYRLIQSGDFPASVSISNRAVAWEESLVDEWLIKKISEQNYKRERAEMKKSPHYVTLERVNPFIRY